MALVIFHKCHYDVAMTHFQKKMTQCFIEFHMGSTTLHFEFQKLGRQKPRYGKMCFWFRKKVPLPSCSKGLTLICSWIGVLFSSTKNTFCHISASDGPIFEIQSAGLLIVYRLQ